MLFTLVYISHALTPFSSDKMLELLRRSRGKNWRLGITGLLLYKQDAFMQALEGDEATVRELYATVREDKRHHRVVTLLAMPIAVRQFPDWSMRFENLGEADTNSFSGYIPSFDSPVASDELSWTGSVAMNLLASFQQHN